MDAAALARSAETEDQPPAGITESLRALWLARADRWHEAHDLCQDLPDPDGAWIHAYLHRVEGDLGNASYWYGRSGRPMPATGVPLEEEWAALVTELGAS